MKKTIMVLALMLGLALFAASRAEARTFFGISIGGPVFYPYGYGSYYGDPYYYGEYRRGYYGRPYYRRYGARYSGYSRGYSYHGRRYYEGRGAGRRSNWR